MPGFALKGVHCALISLFRFIRAIRKIQLCWFNRDSDGSDW